MDGAPRRFSGHPYPEGLLVLDELTGEVVLVPADGSPPRELRRGRDELAVAGPPPRPQGSLPQTDLDREVIATFPYPVASVYARLFEETDPRQQCRLLVDTFATLLKLWSLALASEYIGASQLRDPTLNELLARDFSRPLISAWHLFIVRALSVFKSDNVKLFSPELASAYDVLETKCKTPFMAKTTFEDAKGESRVRESKLGKVQALIKYRNGLAHGYNLPVARAARHLETYLPVLREILGEARFMTRYPLFCITARGPDGTFGARLMGARPSVVPEKLSVEIDPIESLVLVDEKKAHALGLGVLATLDTPEATENALQGLARDVFLFEGNTKSAVTYASALGEHVERQSQAVSWRRSLEQKSVDVAVLRRDDLSLETLRAASTRITRGTTSALERAGKYVPAIAYRPPYVKEWLAQLELGDYRGLVLAGESGSGKSTLAASHANERVEAGDVVLFYRAASLLDADLQARIARDLGLRDLYFEDFLEAAGPLFASGARMRVIVDGVNEHPGDVAALVGSIDAMVRQAGGHPWLRILVTARTAAYERLPKNARFGRLEGTRYLVPERSGSDRPSQVFVLQPLTDEEVGEIYERYRAYDPPSTSDDPTAGAPLRLRPLTAFAALKVAGGRTIAMMRSPLMMRLLLASFHGRELDPDLSFDEAMRLYFEQIVVGQSDRDGANWERGAMLKAIVVELDAVSSDTLERDALHAVPSLKRHLQNAQKDSSYVQLLDLGVLTEHWDRDTCFVRLGFDRLFEFLLADLHERTCADAYGVLGLLRRSTRFGNLVGALAVVLSRAAKTSVWFDAVALAESLPKDAPEKASAVVVGRGVLGRMARQPAQLAEALAVARAKPTLLGAEIMLSAFDRAMQQGETAAALTLIETASALADALGDRSLASRALFGKGRALQQRGELEAALVAFERVAALSAENGDLVAAHRARVKQSEIWSSRGATTEAWALLDAAVPALKNAGALSDAAEARRQQAIVEQAKKDFAAARTLAEDALAIAREAVDPHTEAACAVTCGITAWRQGDLASASRFYETAMRISEHEGNARTMASVSGNLGILARERGDFVSAVAWVEKQLAASRRMEHRPWIASALQNLGVFRHEAGDATGAEASIVEALPMWTELGNHAVRTLDHVMLASFAIGRGDWDRAAALLEEALALADAHDVLDAKLDALWLRAQLAFERRDDDLRAWLDRFAAAGDGSERRAGQLAALEILAALRDSETTALDRALSFVPRMRAAFDDASPLPEIHELPLLSMAELARACDVRGVGGATELASTAKGWLRGRPARPEVGTTSSRDRT